VEKKRKNGCGDRAAPFDGINTLPYLIGRKSGWEGKSELKKVISCIVINI